MCIHCFNMDLESAVNVYTYMWLMRCHCSTKVIVVEPAYDKLQTCSLNTISMLCI